MRATQALVPASGRLCCYVDDPLLLLRGRPAEVNERALVVLLFWRVLGFPLAWEKGAFSECLDWIGAVVELKVGETTVTISDRKRQEFRGQLRALLCTEGK
eukprot:5223644-Amphidinium_carterae.1